MELIIRIDDFGFSEAINLGIMRAFQTGLVKNIGLMSNMPYASHAVGLIKDKDVALGLHTNLIVGKPCMHPQKIPSLVDEHGNLIASKVRRQQWAQSIDGFHYEQTRCEVEAQIDAFISMVGRRPDYIDAHAVCTPICDRAICDAADAYGITIQAHRNSDRWEFANTDMNHSCFYDRHLPYVEFFKSYLTYGRRANLVVFHPGYLDQDVLDRSSLTLERCRDLALLCDEDVRTFLSAHTLLSFKELSIS